MSKTTSTSRTPTVQDDPLVHDGRHARPQNERVRRHQLFLIESLVDRGCSEREIVEALHDDDRR